MILNGAVLSRSQPDVSFVPSVAARQRKSLCDNALKCRRETIAVQVVNRDHLYVGYWVLVELVSGKANGSAEPFQEKGDMDHRWFNVGLIADMKKLYYSRLKSRLLFHLPGHRAFKGLAGLQTSSRQGP